MIQQEKERLKKIGEALLTGNSVDVIDSDSNGNVGLIFFKAIPPNFGEEEQDEIRLCFLTLQFLGKQMGWKTYPKRKDALLRHVPTSSDWFFSLRLEKKITPQLKRRAA